jgi:hypothetical protein
VIILIYPFGRLADFKWGKLTPVGHREPAAIATCVECNSELSIAEMIGHNGAFYCARCKPMLLQRLAEGVEVGASAPKVYGCLFRTWTLWIFIVFIAYALAMPMILVMYHLDL